MKTETTDYLPKTIKLHISHENKDDREQQNNVHREASKDKRLFHLTTELCHISQVEENGAVNGLQRL